MVETLFPFCCSLLLLTHLARAQWGDGMAEMGATMVDDRIGNDGGGRRATDNTNNGGGADGMGYDELNALNLLRTAMEKRLETNGRLKEQLERTNRELETANRELRETRAKIQELGDRCQEFARLKEVMREKLAELENLLSSELNRIGEQQGGAGAGAGAVGPAEGRGAGFGANNGGYGGRSGGGQQTGNVVVGGGGAGGGDQFWNSETETLGVQREKRQQLMERVPSRRIACNARPRLRGMLERELNAQLERIKRLKGMEHKITVSLFMVRPTN